MYWRNLFFDFEGRIRRRDYWIGTIIVVAISAIPLPIFAYGFAIPIEDRPFYNLPLTVLLAYPSMAVLVKRFHDRGKSWLWAAPLYPLYFADFLLLRFFEESLSRLIFEIPFLIYSCWVLVECGFFRGNVGPNRFGADPIPSTSRASATAATIDP